MKHGLGTFLRKSAISLCLLLCFGKAAAADDSIEYQVKAAFLLNFTKFVEWPADSLGAPGSPITVCILGDDPFGHTLDQIVGGELVNGRKLAVQRIRRTPAPGSCQLLFVSTSEKEIARTLPALGPGVLTVGEGESFLRDGGMIAFTIENRRVRFRINQTAAQRYGLKLSSKLLSLARTVE